MQLEKVKFTFTQDPSRENDEAKECGFERISIEYTSCLGLHQDKDVFFIMKTDKEGFSFQNENDLTLILQGIRKAIGDFIRQP